MKPEWDRFFYLAEGLSAVFLKKRKYLPACFYTKRLLNTREINSSWHNRFQDASERRLNQHLKLPFGLATAPAPSTKAIREQAVSS